VIGFLLPFLLIAGDLNNLYLGFGYYPPHLKEWFNSILRDYDFIGTSLGSVDSLLSIQRGLKGTKSPCASELIARYPEYEGRVMRIGYNIEHWPQTPDSEKIDPVGTVKKISEFAHKHNLKLTLGPDRRFDDSYGDSMVLYADHYVLQLQVFESYPDTFKSEAFKRISRLRRVNPQVFIIAQVSVSRGVSLDTIYRCIQLISDSVDGIWVFYTLRDSLKLKGLVEMLRPPAWIGERGYGERVLYKKGEIHYSLKRRLRVRLSLYTPSGCLVEKVLDKTQMPGEYRVRWNPKGLSSGVYFLRLELGREVFYHKVVVLN